MARQPLAGGRHAGPSPGRTAEARGASKRAGQGIGPGFLNPAMAPARTRSVMLLADALEHDWLVPEGAPIRVLDALCSTGVRIRRWRQELPEAHVGRVVLTGNDLDAHAWTGPWLPSRPIPADDPPPVPSTASGPSSPRHRRRPFHPRRRARRLASGRLAMGDLDPWFSNALPDAALQGMARRGVPKSRPRTRRP